jgi:hypothetical protein
MMPLPEATPAQVEAWKPDGHCSRCESTEELVYIPIPAADSETHVVTVCRTCLLRAGVEQVMEHPPK